MKIRVMSDLHLEMGDYEPPEMPGDDETVLILAGDIGLLEKPYTYVEFVSRMSDRFRDVLYVPGNHEYYHGYWPWSEDRGMKALMDLNNVTFGNQFDIVIEDIAFIGSIMWTDFNKCDPYTMLQCHLAMNDFRLTRTGPKTEKWKMKFRPEHVLKFFKETTRDFIFPKIKFHRDAGRKVAVVTHHAPSELSIAPQFKGDVINGSYVSELYDEILNSQPDIWFHGHCHNSLDYLIGDTRVVCNPVGYPTARNKEFNPTLRIEL